MLIIEILMLYNLNPKSLFVLGLHMRKWFKILYFWVEEALTFLAGYIFVFDTKGIEIESLGV